LLFVLVSAHPPEQVSEQPFAQVPSQDEPQLVLSLETLFSELLLPPVHLSAHPFEQVSAQPPAHVPSQDEPQSLGFLENPLTGFGFAIKFPRFPKLRNAIVGIAVFATRFKKSLRFITESEGMVISLLSDFLRESIFFFLITLSIRIIYKN
jgi:hypothetical protein